MVNKMNIGLFEAQLAGMPDVDDRTAAVLNEIALIIKTGGEFEDLNQLANIAAKTLEERSVALLDALKG